MILVTVGTHDQGFNRLVTAMDQLAETLDEPVKIQRGSSTYQPTHAEEFRYVTSDEIEQLYDEARVVVSHAAAGSIILGFHKKRPLVIVPRQAIFDEHIDDHQMQLARAVHEQQRAITVYDPLPETLHEAIEQADALHRNQGEAVGKGSGQLVQALKEQIERWEK